MKIVLNILLILAALGLGYLLVKSIQKPIQFKQTREFREGQVREKLTQTAELQKIYKSLTGKFADNYDSLQYVLTTDTFLVTQVVGDRYDTTQTVSTQQVMIPAKDSLQGWMAKKKIKMEIDEYFNYLSVVPFSKNEENPNGQRFGIETSEAIVEGTDSMMTSTFVVGTPIGTYMQEFDSASHVIYDPTYNPRNLRRVGDLNKPSTNGNW
ncbi:MAG: hypothetical protein ACRBFS_08350 [Aureispira sp.]